MAQPIKVGFCVAYDWPLLRFALPAIYKNADVIYISLDSDQKTWTGQFYDFDRKAFEILIASIDTDNKIKLYQDNFHLSELSAGQNEVRQRNKLAEQMGAGGWHIQLDCDEYFLDFETFVHYLHTKTRNSSLYNVCCPLVTLFKEVDGGFLYVHPKSTAQLEYIQIATRSPHYEYGRRNGNFNVYTNSIIIHQSWARAEAEIRQKVSSWGHVNDFNQEAFLQNWLSLNQSNFTEWKNFHPIAPAVWPSLGWQPCQSVNELMESFNAKSLPLPSTRQLAMRNSKMLSRVRSILKRISAYIK
jgi:hypothetical protein